MDKKRKRKTKRGKSKIYLFLLIAGVIAVLWVLKQSILGRSSVNIEDGIATTSNIDTEMAGW